MSKLIICDLPRDQTLDQQAMSALRGGMSFASRAQPTEPIRSFIPNEPIRIFTLSEPIRPTDTDISIFP
jgi:hypothetical protein